MKGIRYIVSLAEIQAYNQEYNINRIHRRFETSSFGANILPVDCRARLTCFWMAHKAQNPAVRPSQNQLNIINGSIINIVGLLT